MKIRACLSLLLLWSQISSANIRVGNGGEGIIVKDKIYLRDLFEANLHLHPHFGPVAGFRIYRQLPQSALNDFPVSQSLLARKLTDLNVMSPALGYYVLAAINSYFWQLVKTPLHPFPDDGSPLIYAEGQRIPLANRFQSTIRIDAFSWAKLSEEQKVALILHEAIYSLLKPTCDPENADMCKQVSARTREIVARVFSNTAHKLTPQMESDLGLPSAALRTRCSYSASSIWIRIEPKEKDLPEKTLAFEGSAFSAPKTAVEKLQNKFLTEFCDGEFGDMDRITVTFTRDPFKISEKFYTSTNGEQRYLSIATIPGLYEPYVRQQWSVIKQTCPNTLKWLAYLWFNTIEDPVLQNPNATYACKSIPGWY